MGAFINKCIKELIIIKKNKGNNQEKKSRNEKEVLNDSCSFVEQ